jgi:hypothetical protein
MNQTAPNPKYILKWVATVTVILALIVAILFGVAALTKKYGIWSKEQRGRAALAEAQFSKLVQVEEAKANLASEELNAQAEIVRAKGAAESIKAEAGSITPEYIQYLWVRQQKNLNDKTVIYIPTEANLPLLEAPRLQGN